MMQRKYFFALAVAVVAVIMLLVVFMFPWFDPSLSCVEWKRSFGGPGFEVGNSVAVVADGGFVVTGETQSFGVSNSSDVWLIRTNAQGKELWRRTFGGPDMDWGKTIVSTRDGGFVIVGYTQSYGSGQGDVWLVKTNAEGVEQWNATFGGSNDDYGNSVYQTADDGFMVVGETWSYGRGGDAWVVKTDAAGNELWNTTLGGDSYEGARCVIPRENGGTTSYLIVGETESFTVNSSDVWVVCIDDSGAELWNQTYGTVDYDELSNDIRFVSADTFVVAGHAYTETNWDVYVLAFNATGDELWNTTLGGALDDGASSIVPVEDGFMLTGYADRSMDGFGDLWFAKIDRNGTLVKDEKLGSSGDDGGVWIEKTDDAFVVTGYGASSKTDDADLWLLKLRLRD